MYGLILRPAACYIGIYGLFNLLTLTQVFQLRSEKFEVYGVRVIEVMYSFLLFCIVAEILVIRILRNHYNILLKLFCDCLYYCCLSRAGTTGYSYYQHFS